MPWIALEPPCGPRLHEFAIGRTGVVVALLLSVTACAAGQNPGLAPPTSNGTATTSRMLGPCPPGGPDPTTPLAGCVGPDGSVRRP